MRPTRGRAARGLPSTTPGANVQVYKGAKHVQVYTGAKHGAGSASVRSVAVESAVADEFAQGNFFRGHHVHICLSWAHLRNWHTRASEFTHAHTRHAPSAATAAAPAGQPALPWARTRCGCRRGRPCTCSGARGRCERGSGGPKTINDTKSNKFETNQLVRGA